MMSVRKFSFGSTNNPLIDIFSFPITCQLDIILILYGEILSWSLMGVSGLTGTVILFLNSQTIKQHTLYIFQMTNFKKIHDILMEHI